MIKLNLGCANDIKSGYINIDKFHSHPNVLVKDVRNLEEYRGKQVSEIYASDIVEHMGFEEAVKAVTHWCDILSSGGRIYIQTIAIESLTEALQKGYWNIGNFNAKLFAGRGWVDGVSRDHDWHKCAFSTNSMKELLTKNNVKIDTCATDPASPTRMANLNMKIWGTKQ